MFKLYSPDNPLPNVFYIRDDVTGVDWYEFQKTLDQDNVKIAVDATNVVRFAFTDPTSVFPKDCDVYSPSFIPPEFMESFIGWMYVDGEFIHVENTDFYKEKKDSREFDELKNEYRELRLQSDLGIISKEDLHRMKVLNDLLVEKYKK